jgi:hypothetical protein
MSRAIQFFHELTIPALGKFNSAADYLFSHIIPQLGESEVPIKHQLVAIAAVQELYGNNRPSQNDTTAVSSKHYGKALKILADPSKTPTTEVMLASCLLSIAMENFRNDSKSSFLHLHSGLQVLRQWKFAHESYEKRLPEADEVIRSYIEPIFAQLEATAAMTGDAGAGGDELQGSDLHWRRPQLPEVFPDLALAREKFFEIGYWLYIRNKRHPNFPFDGPEFWDIDDLWHQWYRAFTAFFSNIPSQAELERLEAVQLGVHYRVHYITFKCQSTPGTELVWDEYVEAFRDCVWACEELYQRDDIYGPGAGSLNTAFCRDPGILPPAWQIAVSCRDPLLRHRAIELLKGHHRRCGDTDDCSAATMAEVIVGLEEKGLSVRTCADIPESRRVRALEADLTQPGKLIVTYARSPYLTPETTEVPLHVDSAPPVLPFKLFPLGEAVRLAGYQGLVRPRTYACRCKSYGVQ